MNDQSVLQRIQQTLGPGLLFAAVSIGVSHLVQSTRAGALYGLGMVGIIVLANVLKYPAFRLGPEYTAISGKTILYGFRRQGMWALLLFAFLSVPHMFGGGASVTLVAAGIIKNVFGLEADVKTIVAGILIVCPLILILGKYHLLDRLMKLLMLILLVSTIIATVIIIPGIEWDPSVKLYPSPMELSMVLFLVALFGWMPAPVDVAVWHSLWAKAKVDDTADHFSRKRSAIDFHVGYIGTAVLALCFMLLGFVVMYNSGQTFSGSPAEFADQFIGLYTQALGDWSAPIIKISVLAVILSTNIVVIDAYPRAIAAISQQWDMDVTLEDRIQDKKGRQWYMGSMLVLVAGILLIIYVFTGAFTTLIDFATTFSFLAAPILAWLIHRSVFSDDIDPSQQPSPALRRFSKFCYLALALFALSYLYIRIVYV